MNAQPHAERKRRRRVSWPDDRIRFSGVQSYACSGVVNGISSTGSLDGRRPYFQRANRALPTYLARSSGIKNAGDCMGRNSWNGTREPFSEMLDPIGRHPLVKGPAA